MKTLPEHPVRFDLLEVEEAARLLGADPRRGLSPAEAASRLAAAGPNELPPPRRDRWPLRLARQFYEPMAVLLIAAAAVDGIGLREHVDAAAILSIVVLNAFIALVQEGKAARDLEALRTMETPTARVLRDGAAVGIPSPEIVPGDVVLLAAGDRVPADVRLAEMSVFEVDESILTGESLAVAKGVEPVADERAGLSDRTSIAFTGTLVTRGTARGIAVATGLHTELGAIAERLAVPQSATPLQRELARLTTRLGGLAVAIAFGVFALTLARTGLTSEGVERAFLPAVALAVAAVPEGLATVVTVGLALGVRRMAARGAIVRRLPAVETLGSTTVILTDKTGTLTENRMRLESIALPGRPPAPRAELPPAAGRRAAEVAVLCNDASLKPPSGDPLEVALLEALETPDITALRSALPRVAEIPFDSERKRMTTVHRAERGAVLLVKGAPETVSALCADALTAEGSKAPFGEGERAALLAGVEELAGGGMRTLALARRDLPAVPEDPEKEEHDFTLVGLVGLRDPVRAEARAAVAETRSAGIHLVMVTGDHAGTGAAVAREVGLAGPESRVMTGAELREAGIPDDPRVAMVYARVDPDQKLALVEAFQGQGEVVAVTGDGVNDAPALRRADIGVAMGRAGSDVAREAADMVVTDDNLATIVAAVREGRGIYDNIRKVVDYLVAGNLSEISVVVGGLLLFPDLGVPLLPLQLLWINLLTDGLPAVALGLDPAEPRLMERPPRPRDDRLLAGRRIGLLSGRGLLIAAASLGSLVVARFAWHEPWDHARAVMFTVLVAAHLLYAFAVRRPSGPGAGRGALARLASNPWLLVAIGLGLLLQLTVVTLPVAHSLFGTAPLTAREWALVAAGGALPVLLMAAPRPTLRRRSPS